MVTAVRWEAQVEKAFSFPAPENIYRMADEINMSEKMMTNISSVAQACPTLYDPMNCSTPSLPLHHQILEFTQTHVHWVSDAIQQSHPLSSPSSPTLNLSNHQVFSNESALRIQWPKYWSFSFNISPSNEHPGLISFRMEWLDLLAVQGTLNSLLRHHSSKASILPDWVEKEVEGGIGMWNTCKSMADSCQCMAKTTTIL